MALCDCRSRCRLTRLTVATLGFACWTACGPCGPAAAMRAAVVPGVNSGPGVYGAVALGASGTVGTVDGWTACPISAIGWA